MHARFDTMLETVLRFDGADAAADAAAWRQIVDVLAQAGDDLSPDIRALAFDRLRVTRRGVAAGERRLAAASLAGRTSDIEIAELFASDLPAVAAPFLSRLALSSADWVRLLPVIPPTARNIVRNRRDLPPGAVDMLARYAAGDLALPRGDKSSDIDAVARPGVSQIRDLVDRIAAFRQRPAAGQTAQPVARDDAVSPSFIFETDRRGLLDYVEGVPREALIGLTIAEIAPSAGAGVDGQAAGAWRRRAPFRDARLVVAGEGPTGGLWLVSGNPLFNPRHGRFCGYRGSARRAQFGERVDTDGLRTLQIDSLRQLVHELRTPLNAIQGFAEMIGEQILGPADYAYRRNANDIVHDARRLGDLVDDIDSMAHDDLIAQGETAVPLDFEAIDLAQMLTNIADRQRAVLDRRGVGLTVKARALGQRFSGSSRAVERFISRLLNTIGSVTPSGETLVVDMAPRGVGVCLSISRPASIAGLSPLELRDPKGPTEEAGPEGPLLGLGFTLRLVSKLAMQNGATLEILPDQFEIIFGSEQQRAGDIAS